MSGLEAGYPVERPAWMTESGGQWEPDPESCGLSWLASILRIAYWLRILR